MLLTIAQVATTLGVGRSKVYTFIKQEGLPTISLGRGLTRVSVVSLEQWIQQRETRHNT